MSLKLDKNNILKTLAPVFWISFCLVGIVCQDAPKIGISKNDAPSPSGRSISSSIADVEELFRDDPLAKHQWHLLNVGQKAFARLRATQGNDLQISQAISDGIDGQKVKVAIVDTGVEVMHDDLMDNIDLERCRNYDDKKNAANNYSGDPTPKDRHATAAHGTSVAGIIGAVSNNNIGVRGIAPKAKLAGLRYVNLESYSPSDYKDIVERPYIGDYDIYNFSIGGVQFRIWAASEMQEMALLYGTKYQRNGLGSIYVKAGGNEWSVKKYDGNYAFGNTNFEQLNTYPYVIVVGASNANGKIASYSSPGSSLWVMAPGGEDGKRAPAILTTDLSGCDSGRSTFNSKVPFDKPNGLNKTCDYTASMNGSSAATPMISGIAALMLQANPKLTWRDVKHILAVTADKPASSESVARHPRNLPMPEGYIYQDGWTTNAAGYSFHNWYGFGTVNGDKAVEMAKNYKSDWGEFISTEIRSNRAKSTRSGYILNKSPYFSMPMAEIPDFNADGVTDEIEIKHDLIIENVQLEISIVGNNDDEDDYAFAAEDIAIELYSPSGTKSIILNGRNGISDVDLKKELFGSNAFYGEKSLGVWKIKVIDTGANESTGILKRWALRIHGHANHEENIAVDAPTGLKIETSSMANALNSPIFSWNKAAHPDFLRYDVAVYDEEGTEIIPWHSAGEENSCVFNRSNHGVMFKYGHHYTLKVRTVVRGENYSTPASFTWSI